MSPNTDPFTDAIRKFFASLLVDSLVDQKVGLYFDPLPVAMPAEEFEIDGAFNEQMAEEAFSTFIADHAAQILKDNHIKSGDLARLVEFEIYDSATFYRRPDLIDTLNEKNQETFEKLLSSARKNLNPKARLHNSLSTYYPSRAVPRNWCNPLAETVWKRHSLKFENQASQNTSDTTHHPSTSIPWKVIGEIDIEKIRKELEKHKIKKLPGPLPPWVDPIPPWADLRIVDETGRENLIKFAERLKEKGVLLPFAGPAAIRPADFRPDLTAGLGVGTVVLGGQMMQTDGTGVQYFSTGLKLEDFDNSEDTHLAEITKRAVWETSSTSASSDVKDRIEVSFDYQFVDITRDWLFEPLLHNTNWYIPDKRKGELTRGLEGNSPGNLSCLPIKCLVVRNLKIEANFTDADRKSIGQSFAIGPFRIDRNIDVQSGSVFSPGMQVIAYLDREMPDLPPRSDPAFPT